MFCVPLYFTPIYEYIFRTPNDHKFNVIWFAYRGAYNAFWSFAVLKTSMTPNPMSLYRESLWFVASQLLTIEAQKMYMVGEPFKSSPFTALAVFVYFASDDAQMASVVYSTFQYIYWIHVLHSDVPIDGRQVRWPHFLGVITTIGPMAYNFVFECTEETCLCSYTIPFSVYFHSSTINYFIFSIFWIEQLPFPRRWVWYLGAMIHGCGGLLTILLVSHCGSQTLVDAIKNIVPPVTCLHAIHFLVHWVTEEYKSHKKWHQAKSGHQAESRTSPRPLTPCVV